MKLFTGILLLLALISGFVCKGSFLHTILLLAAGVYLGLPLLLFLCLWFLFGWFRTGGISSRLRGTFCVFVLIALAMGLSWGVGTLVHRLEIRQVRSYVEQMVPLLDDYYEAQEQYPESLDVLEERQIPSLLRYLSIDGGDGFVFSYWDEAGLMGGYLFNSESRKWIYFD
ncbi:MAG: hypothetical protein ACON39_06360 [Coraliomargaritaceae bacterium]